MLDEVDDQPGIKIKRIRNSRREKYESGNISDDDVDIVDHKPERKTKIEHII